MMMKSGRIYLISLVFLLVILACSTTPSPLTPQPGTLQPGPSPTQPSRSPGDPGFNLLITAEGGIALKRDGWINFHPTTFGAVLQRNDQLQLASGARALVLCDDLSIWPVPDGSSSINNGCQPPFEPYLIRDESLLGNVRAGLDLNIPFIISPRMKNLLTTQPILRWNASPGAAYYNVQLRADEGVYWEVDQITGTEIVYPGTPPLEPGATYLLIITADTGVSSRDEGIAGLGFRMLAEPEATKVQLAQDKLAIHNLSTEAQGYALAQLYSGRGLFTEAIELLEALAKAGSQNAAIYHLLGDLYLQIVLPPLAESHFLEAERLAGVRGDVERQILAQTGLSITYAALGNIGAANQWLNSAQTNFDSFGEPANQLAEGLGAAYLALANPDLAIEWWRTAQEGYLSVTDLEHASKLAEQIGDVYANVRDLEEAIQWWQEAWQTYEELGKLRQSSELAEQIGEAYATLKEVDEAIRWLEVAREGYAALAETPRVDTITARIEELKTSKP